MTLRKLRKYIGLAGVSGKETTTAKRWGNYYAAFMIVVTIGLLLQLYLEKKHDIPLFFVLATNWIVWAAFIAETVTLTYLVQDKTRYLLNNWLNLFIIVVGFPLIWENTQFIAILRLLQLLIVFRLGFPIWDTSIRILSRNNLGATLLVCFIITVVWGILLSAVDPSIGTPWDGIWWAWETATTVGYGDIVPTTGLGRLLAAMLMVMGFGLISLLAANFSAYFISKSPFFQKERKELLEVLIVLEEINKRLERLENKSEK